MDEKSTLGFEKLSVENWLQPVDIMRHLARYSPETGNFHIASGEDWVRAILQPELSEEVPLEVQELFEGARGALAYGYFFYPLYMLGIEQASRVAETATDVKCTSLDAPPGATGNFRRRIDWLAKRDILDKQYWQNVIEVRNSSSHLDRQRLIAPGEAVRILSYIAEAINGLFKDEERNSN